MALARSAALKIDWAKITATLGLKGQTLASLQSFKKRNEDARRKYNVLSESPQTLNFDYYRQHLKNHKVVDEIEAAFKQFKPATYDVSKQIKAIETFEAKAVESALQTKEKVDAELKDLEATLKNIESARSFDELTVDDVAAARPEIDKRTEQMVIRGKWMPPGYQERFGNLSLL